ncbi:SIS domain-containing protein, partial [Nocardioides sp. NPDC057772]|uniref:SIS domain-containing protein n=1 Tax=Nocardioides sp. NPDC057772 TaxID=3346245 RepID=UPI00366F374B
MTASAPTHLAAEIATQPADWLAARGTAERFADALPEAGEKVAVVGCGTSLYMAQAYAALREEQGQGVTDAWTPTEARIDRGYDRLLAITRSGTTTEVIDLLTRVNGKVPASVISSSPGTPALELAEPILMPEVDEKSVVQTRFATTALAVLRWHLGHDLTQASAQAQQIIDAGADGFGPALSADQLTFVGRGWTNGLAQEAALKLRESAQLWTESYPFMDY